MEPVTRKIHLLLVEDNPGDVELFRWALEQEKLDFDLQILTDGGAALEMIHSESAAASPAVPDLVVLDLNLPRADGREVLKELRASRTFARVPVMIMTSSTSVREREQLKPLNVARHITKPADLSGFLGLGTQVLEVLRESSASPL